MEKLFKFHNDLGEGMLLKLHLFLDKHDFLVKKLA